MSAPSFRDEELLADTICRLIGDVRHIAVGSSSPIPATAALLARERANLNSNTRKPYVSLLGSRAHTVSPPEGSVHDQSGSDSRSSSASLL